MNDRSGTGSGTSELAELHQQIAAWHDQGKKLALAIVIKTWGSSPRPVGSHLVVTEDALFSGSVSGGCIEAAVIEAAGEVIDKAQAVVLNFGITNEQAWDVGLSCGGDLKVLICPLDKNSPQCQALQPPADAGNIAIVTHVPDGRQCSVRLGDHTGPLQLSEAQLKQTRYQIQLDQSTLLADDSLFVRVYCPPFRLLVFGAVHITQFLVPMAEQAGYSVCVIDPRRGFAAESRFPHLRVIQKWPEQALAQLKPDRNTAIVMLCHDPKIDDPALQFALNSPAFYIGALGSKRTHAKRLQRLKELNLERQAKKIHAPIGLDLGGRAPAEIAVSILAQIIKIRYQHESA